MAQSGRWIRLEIPYGEGADSMGGTLGYRGLPGDGGDGAVADINAMMSELMPQMADMGLNLGALSEVQVLSTTGHKTVAETLDALATMAAEKDVELGEQTTVVFPLDARMSLAWSVKEEAEQRGFEFDRHIPHDAQPADGLVLAAEPTRDADDAAIHMNRLCEQAMAAGEGAEFGEAMTCMREAVGLAITHFGWTHHYTGHMVRYLGQFLRATGNDDNGRENVLYLRTLCYALEQDAGGRGEWSEQFVACLGTLSEEAEELDDAGIVARLQALVA